MNKGSSIFGLHWVPQIPCLCCLPYFPIFTHDLPIERTLTAHFCLNLTSLSRPSSNAIKSLSAALIVGSPLGSPSSTSLLLQALALVTHNSRCSCLETCLLALTTGKASFSKDGGGSHILSRLLLLSARHRENPQHIPDELNFPARNNPVISQPPGPLLPASGSWPLLVLLTVPMVTSGPLRNNGNVRMGTRQSLT